MYFLFGILLSVLCGLTSPLCKKAIKKTSVAKYMVLYSFFNLLFCIPYYKLILHKDISLDVLANLPMNAVILLVLYLFLRIVSNTSQTLLLADNKLDVNIVSVVLTQTCFLTIFIDFILTGKFYPMVLVGLTISVIGVIIITVNFRDMKFYFNLQGCVLLLFAFVATGTKPSMAHQLLSYIPIEIICFLEYVNYFVIYIFRYRAEVKNITKEIKPMGYVYIIMLSFISQISCYIQYITFGNIIISTITSVTVPIFTALFGYLILKNKISKKTLLGIFIIIIGVVLAKFFYR